MSQIYLKTNRIFSPWRKYAWIFTLTVAVGGLWFPLLGLLVLPVMLGLTAVSFIKGRYWCGNICPHGSLFESLLEPFAVNRHIPDFLKTKAFGIGFFAFFGYNLFNRFITASTHWGSLLFWERVGFIFVASYLMVTIVGGLGSVFISSRTWCTFCPMGTMQKASYWLGRKTGISKLGDEKIKISQLDACISCGKCAKVCPMQLSPYQSFSDKNQFDCSDCIKCSTCVKSCPVQLLSLEKIS